METSNEAIVRFFDREACCAQARPGDGGLSRVSAALLSKLTELGLGGLSVLDVGCGTGTLTAALAQRGARMATGMDLSPGAIAAAARRTGTLADRMRFVVGDGASAALDEYDVVVLNRVVCCYPDAQRLLDNTLPAARRFVALSSPASSGLRGMAARVLLAGENALRWLRRDPFRAYVHALGEFGDRGVRRVWHGHRGIWRLELYETAPQAPPAGATAG